MKKNNRFTKILAAALTMLLIAGMMPLAIHGESLRFGIFEVAVTDVEQPKGYMTPDFNVSVIDSAPYSVYEVRWTDLATGERMTEEDEFIYGQEYEIEVVLEANPYYYFRTDEYGYPDNITGTVKGDAAEVDCAPSEVINASSYESFDIAVQKFVSVKAAFTAWEYPYFIEEINVSLKAPMPGDAPAKMCNVTGGVPSFINNSYVELEKIVWTETETGRELEFGETFQYGKEYTAALYFYPIGTYLFADDPSHPLATADKPFTAVEGTINGNKALVQPDFDKGPARKHIIISRVFACNTVTAIKEVNVEISAPKTDAFPSYVAIISGKGIEQPKNSTSYEKNGISWTQTGGLGVPTFGYTFEADTAYSVAVRIDAIPGYEFDDPTVTVNGQPAQLIPGKNSITVCYNFPKTAATGDELLGDINLDGSLDISDALQLFLHSMLPSEYPIYYQGSTDFVKDGSLDIKDALQLFLHSMLPDDYPLA